MCSPPTAAREGSARGEVEKLKGIAVSNQTEEYNALAIGAKQVGRRQLEQWSKKYQKQEHLQKQLRAQGMDVSARPPAPHTYLVDEPTKNNLCDTIKYAQGFADEVSREDPQVLEEVNGYLLQRGPLAAPTNKTKAISDLKSLRWRPGDGFVADVSNYMTQLDELLKKHGVTADVIGIKVIIDALVQGLATQEELHAAVKADYESRGARFKKEGTFKSRPAFHKYLTLQCKELEERNARFGVYPTMRRQQRGRGRSQTRRSAAGGSRPRSRSARGRGRHQGRGAPAARRAPRPARQRRDGGGGGPKRPPRSHGSSRDRKSSTGYKPRGPRSLACLGCGSLAHTARSCPQLTPEQASDLIEKHVAGLKKQNRRFNRARRAGSVPNVAVERFTHRTGALFARARKARKSKLASDAPGSLAYNFFEMYGSAKPQATSWGQPSVKDLHPDLKEPASPSVRLDVGMPDPKRVGGLEDKPAPPTPNAPASGMDTDGTYVSIERACEWTQVPASSARSGEEQPLPLPEGLVSTEEGPRKRPVVTESPLPPSSQSEQTDGSGLEQTDDGAPEQPDDGAPAVRSVAHPTGNWRDYTLLSLSEDESETGLEQADGGGPAGLQRRRIRPEPRSRDARGVDRGPLDVNGTPVYEQDEDGGYRERFRTSLVRVDSLEVHRRRLAQAKERRGRSDDSSGDSSLEYPHAHPDGRLRAIDFDGVTAVIPPPSRALARLRDHNEQGDRDRAPALTPTQRAEAAASPKRHRARVRYCGSRFQLGLYKTEKEKNAAIGTFNAALETGRAPRFVNAEERKQAFASLAKRSQEQVGREIRKAEKLKQEKALAEARPEPIPAPGAPLPPPTTAVPTHIPLPQVQAEPASPRRDGASSPLLDTPLSPVSQLLEGLADVATPTSFDCSDCTAGTCETCDSCGGTKNMLCGRRSPCLCGWAEKQPDFHTAV